VGIVLLKFGLLLAVQQTWTLSPQPVVRIGEVEAEQQYMFSLVTGALRLSDGRLIVANGSSNELRVYDAKGKHLTTLGRTGGGPGEFQTLRGLWPLPADSFIAVDARNGRLTFFSSAPTMSHTIQVPTIPGANGRMADGSLIATVGLAPPEKREMKDFHGLIDFIGLVLRRGPNATAYDTIVRGKAGQSLVVTVPPSFRQYPFPYGRTAQIAVGRNRFYYGDTHSTELGIYDLSGQRTGSIKIRGSGRALSQADIDKWVDVEVEKRTTPQTKTDTRTAFRDIPAPKRSPEFAALKLDDAGNLWVREYGPPWDPSLNWNVHDESGKAIGRVRMPPRFEPMHIGRDFILGVSKDELDVERVELYSLRR
jgi:hypothetical protein